MSRRFWTTAVALGVLIALAGPSTGASQGFPDPASEEAAAGGSAHLASTQGDDGSVPGGWRVDQVAETIVALVAGGGQDDAVRRALGFVETHAAGFLDPADGEANGPRIGRVVAGLVAAGEDPRTFAGVDWVQRLELSYVPGTGSYGGESFYADVLAMLGVLAAGRPLPLGAVERIRVNQCNDPAKPAVHGGWTWQVGCVGTPDTDTTSLAMSVLVEAAGPDGADVRRARDWLLGGRHVDGCWGHTRGKFENANSCGLGVSAVLALGEDPRAAPWGDETVNPARRLRAFQRESGGLAYRAVSTKPDDYATVQAVPALAGWSYPVSGPDEPEDPDGPEAPGDQAPDDPNKSEDHQAPSGPAGLDNLDEHVRADKGAGAGTERSTPPTTRPAPGFPGPSQVPWLSRDVPAIQAPAGAAMVGSSSDGRPRRALTEVSETPDHAAGTGEGSLTVRELPSSQGRPNALKAAVGTLTGAVALTGGSAAAWVRRRRSEASLVRGGAVAPVSNTGTLTRRRRS